MTPLSAWPGPLVPEANDGNPSHFSPADAGFPRLPIGGELRVAASSSAMARATLYSTHEVAGMLQVDPSTVSKWMDKGLMLNFKTPGGHRRVRREDLRNFLLKHEMPVPAELGTQKLRLLLVDDDKPSLDATRRQLKAASDNVELVTTTSGVEALLLLHENSWNGLIVDLEMPTVSGLEVLRRVCAHPKFQGVKLFALSAHMTPEAAREAKRAGATACFSKPLDARELLTHFDNQLKLSR